MPSRTRLLLLSLLAALPLAAGCRQKMAEQPYHRPLEQADFFPDRRASRPLEAGTIHRAQRLESDPLVTGLTAAEWGLAYKYNLPMKIDAQTKLPPTLTEEQRKERSVGAPRYDPRVAGQPKVYVEEFPFPITQEHLKRGQDRFTIYCAVCHGPLGNGQGKIWERGYLTPTSFHRKPVDKNEVVVSNPQGLGVSRGYSLWGVGGAANPVHMDEVPVGYIFEVITHGYGGMPSYSAQIPPEDRWKIVAYVRALQYTQSAPGKQPDAGGKKK